MCIYVLLRTEAHILVATTQLSHPLQKQCMYLTNELELQVLIFCFNLPNPGITSLCYHFLVFTFYYLLLVLVVVAVVLG